MADAAQGARALFLSGRWDEMPQWQLAPMIVYYVLLFAGRELIRIRGTVLTASLAFLTALAAVPLGATAVALFAALNFPIAEIEPFVQRVFPANAADLAAYLEGFAASNAAGVAGAAALGFFGVGIFVFVAVESTFNLVWNAERSRSWFQKAVAYLILTTTGALTATASVILSGRAHFLHTQFGEPKSTGSLVLALLIGLCFFVAVNHFLPTARVRWWASLLAGLFTAVGLEIGKLGLNLYASEVVLVPYSQFYGALGFFPLVLVWLYCSWIVILVGAELAYVAQNLRTLAFIQSAKERRPGLASEHVFTPLIGLELYTPVARAFKGGKGRIAEKDLLPLTGYPESVIRSVVNQLEELGAVDVVEDEAGERGLLPAKQLDDIKLLPLVDGFFDFELQPNSQPMSKLMRGYRAVTLEVLRGLNALSLIPADDELGNKYASMSAFDPLPESSLSEASSSAWREAKESPPKAAAPPPDDDPLESPPSTEKPTLPAPGSAPRRVDRDPEPAPSRTVAGRPVAAAATRPRPDADSDVDEEIPQAVAEESADGIRIHTQDILLEEEGDAAGALPKAESKRKKQTSIEIDVAGMWDDFEVDHYDEILQATEEAMSEASEPRELGNERSVPPPVPKSKSD